MHYTRVKICGITRIDDALHAAHQGVDALGLVFYEKSPRYVTALLAAEICSALPAFVTTVALFKDADTDDVNRVLDRVQIDLVQFHGSEPGEFCRQFGKPYIKALGMIGATNIVEQARDYVDARGVLLDGHAPGADGGTGNRFDWAATPKDLAQPLILAGGLDVNNVTEAIKTVRPFAVDVSSGVENKPGLKDRALVTEFMNRVRQVNGELNRNE